MKQKGTWFNSAAISTSKGKKALFYGGLILIPLLIAFFCICIGRYTASPAEVAGVIGNGIMGRTDPAAVLTNVVWSIRLPRVLLALLVGGGLSVAGTAFQSLFANPLATPDTLGVAAGSSFGAVLALFFGIHLIGVQLSALVAGFAAVLLTYLIGRGSGRGLTTVILAGMVISSLFSALVSLVKFVADTDSQLPAITYWLMGSLSSASFYTLALGAPFILIGVLLLVLLRWRLNILPLSEDEVRSSGTNLNLLRFLTALASTMITAACVSMCGQVGWVGLLIPHICRMAFGNDNLILVPASISFGAAFMVIIDTVARSATAAEIPISILTALIGAPFFISLLRRTGGWNL